MTSPAPRRQPSRAARVRDAVALGLLLLGAAGYYIAGRGMDALIVKRPYATLTGPQGGSNMEIWGRYWQLSRASLLVAGIGIAVGLWSFVLHLRTPHVPDGQDHGS